MGVLGISSLSSMTVGEGAGAGWEKEVNMPDGWTRVGMELRLPSGTEERGSPRTVEEGSTAELEGTTSEGVGDWVGRLGAGLDKKTVEMTVTVTGSPAAGSPTEVVGEGSAGTVESGSTGGVKVGSPDRRVEDGSTDRRVEDGSTDKRVEVGSTDERVEVGSPDKRVEDGSTKVGEGSTAVGFPGVPLERVTLLPSKSASLRERSEWPLPMA